jgi:CubicO group peptidase (beta-lactamase class C family)
VTPLPRSLALLDQGRAAGLHRGAQLYVSLRGQSVAEAAIGESRPGVPMTADTINLWFSSGKPLTAVAIAQSLERGLLSLDDPVARFIPEFATHGKESSTIRHLLTHTAGFRDADKLPSDLGWEETIARICATPAEADWPPGKRAGYQYFSSWFVLGEMVRRLDGRAFGDYIREEILLPLGMSDSWMGIPPKQFQNYGERLGWMHLVTATGLKPRVSWNNEAVAASCRPGSNARGPMRELGQLYEALLGFRARADGSPLLSVETDQLFTARHRVGLFDETFQHTLDWGLGFLLDSNRYGADTVPYGYGSHSSEETFGHGGSQSSSAFADPKHGLVVAWICNGMPGEKLHQVRARDLNTALYEDLGLA